MVGKRKFRDEWMTEGGRPWLEPVEGDHELAFCTYCQKIFKAEITSVKRHAKSNSHLQNTMQHEGGDTIELVKGEEERIEVVLSKKDFNTWLKHSELSPVKKIKQKQKKKKLESVRKQEEEIKKINVWTHEEFQPWLKSIESDSELAYCCCCKKEFSSEFISIKRHSISKVHRQNEQKSLEEEDEEDDPNEEEEVEHDTEQEHEDHNMEEGEDHDMGEDQNMEEEEGVGSNRVRRKFREEWMTQDFQPWLEQIEGDPEKAYCRTCEKVIMAEITSIKRHSTSKAHLDNEEKAIFNQQEGYAGQVNQYVGPYDNNQEGNIWPQATEGQQQHHQQLQHQQQPGQQNHADMWSYGNAQEESSYQVTNLEVKRAHGETMNEGAKSFVSMEEFKPWLKLVEGYPEKVYCKSCHIEMDAELSVIELHSTSKLHSQNKKGKVKGKCKEKLKKKVKKEKPKKDFEEIWRVPEYQSWLYRIEGYPEKAFCSICQMVLTGDLKVIQKHSTGKIHADNEIKMKNGPQALYEEIFKNAEYQPWLTEVEGFPGKAFCTYCQIVVDANRSAIKLHSVIKSHKQNKRKNNPDEQKKVRRKFRDAWIDEETEPWLQAVEGDPESAFCKFCQSELVAEITTIKRHSLSKVHLQNKTEIDLGKEEARNHKERRGDYGVKKMRTFREDWLKRDFTPWLKTVKDSPDQAFCSVCERVFNAEITSIKRHSTSKVHLQNYQEKKDKKNNPDEKGAPTVREKTNRGTVKAYILFACFIAENNLPISSTNSLANLMKRMFADSAVARNFSMKRTKCTDIIKVLGKTINDTLAKKLWNSKFSVYMHELTDLSKIKSYAIVVRFYDSMDQKISTALLDLVDVNDIENCIEGANGHNLSSLLIKTLTKYDIPLTNFMGFSAEGASSSLEDTNSLCFRLQNLVPGLAFLKKKSEHEDPLYKMISFLSTKKALDSRSRRALPSLQNLVNLVPRLEIDMETIQRLDYEWRSLDFISIPDEIRGETNVETFYTGLGNILNDQGNFMFSALANFALHICSLPTPNTDVERIVAKINLLKTKARNNLQLPVITALITVSEEVRKYGGCASYTVSDEMINTVKALYKNRKSFQPPPRPRKVKGVKKKKGVPGVPRRGKGIPPPEVPKQRKFTQEVPRQPTLHDMHVYHTNWPVYGNASYMTNM